MIDKQEKYFNIDFPTITVKDFNFPEEVSDILVYIFFIFS